MFIREPAQPNRAIVGLFMPNDLVTHFDVDDAVTPADAKALEMGLSVGSTVTCTATQTLAVGMQLADTVSVQEAAVKHTGASVADAVTCGDAIGTVMDMRMFVADTAVMAAAAAREFAVALSEAVQLTDWSKQKKTQDDFRGA